MKVYRFLTVTLSGFFRCLYRIKIVGKENEPANGPYLVCVNHTSNRDVVVLGASLKNQVRFFAKLSLFKVPLLKGLITTLGAFPVDKSTPGASFAAIKNSINLLNDGQVVAVFPQGKRMPGIEPSQTAVQSGVGMMVCHAKCRVLPVCIQTKGWKVRPFRRTYVHIGKPIEYDEFDFTNSKGNDFKKASELIFSRITGQII